MKNQDLEPTWNGYFLRLQQEAPRPHPVKCNCRKVFENCPPFYGEEYHGLISREDGEQLCTGEGDFLIRGSQTEPGRFALVFRILDNVKNFKLYYEDGQHFVGEKRFDSVYSLVEDGLITIYVEDKGKDFLKIMSQQPVYNSLSRYSSLGSNLGSRQGTFRQPNHSVGEPRYVESIGCMNDGIEGFEQNGYNQLVYSQNHAIYDVSNEANFRPGYVPRTKLEISCYPNNIAEVYGRDMSREAATNARLGSEWKNEVYRGLESSGGHKKMLTPTSSDERKRTKKRFATEDRFLTRTASNGEHKVTSPIYSPPMKPESRVPNIGSHYQGVQDAGSDRFSHSQHLNCSAQLYSSNSNSRFFSASGSFCPRSPLRSRDIYNAENNAAVQYQIDRNMNGFPHKDFSQSQILPQNFTKLTRSRVPKSNPVENLFQHERNESFGSCESGISNLSSVERCGTSSSRHTHDSHPNMSEDEFNFSGHHRALLRCSSGSPSTQASGVRRTNSKPLEEKSPWRRRSEVEKNLFSTSFNAPPLQKSSENTSVFSSSHANSDFNDLKRITQETKRERRNSFDTSSLSRTHKIAIQPIPKPKPPLNRASSTANSHPAIQKSKAILRRVSSFGKSKRNSPSGTPSRKGSIREKSNKSKQTLTEDSKNKSPLKFKKSNSVTSSNSAEVTAALRQQNSVTSPQGIAQQYEKQHQYKPHTYRGFQWCEYCGNFMWGIIQQGVQCRDCGLNVHKQCSKLVPNECQPALKHVKHVFGVDLTTLVKLHCTQRPLVVDMCIEEIEKKGLESEGIYRIPGCHDDIMIVKAAFDQYGQDVDLSTEQDINTIAGALKLYFRELPVPLIPYQLYSRFVNAAKLTHEDGKLNAFRTGLSAIPEAHFQTLKHLIFHLGAVSDRSVMNQMSANNLGVVFGPTLLRAPAKSINSLSINDTHYQQQVVETMIEFRHHLFL